MNRKVSFNLAAIFVLFLLMGTNVRAATETTNSATDEFAEGKALIDQKIACQQVSQDQLEKVGDYYMEQMMPGAAHENMEQILGGEGSESLRQAHIFMARRWYCGDAAGYGMMGMMFGNGYTQNYGSGMMGWANQNFNRGFSMMGNVFGYGTNGNWGGSLILLLKVIFLTTGIAVFVKYLLKK